MTYKPDMMIYHANCADGFGAAWAAWLRWGDTVEYVPCAYGQPAPDVLGKQAWEIACGAYEDASSERDDLSKREMVLAGDAAQAAIAALGEAG